MSELISVALGGRPASCSSKTEATLSVDWVAEGFTLVLLGVLVAAVTMRGGSADPVTQAVYAVASGALLVFAVWTAATAARGSVISNTPGRPARGSAEPTLSTAAAGLPAVRRFGPAAGQPVRGHRSELRCPDRGESQ
jgi:hypothetical protein